MRKILSSPIFRAFLCAVLICALLINVSPIKAKADAIAGAAIVKASTVTCNPYIICAAILIACGVYAGVETGVFDTFVNNCVSTLEAAGTWIKDGVVELLQTTDSYGNVSYYASGDFMNAVCGTITVEALIKAGLAIPADSFDDYYQYCMNQALAARYYALLNTGTRVVLAWSNTPFKVYPNANTANKDRLPYQINTESGASYWRYYHGLVNSSGFPSYDLTNSIQVSSYAIYKSDGNEVLSYVPGLEIGTLAPYGTFTDGSSARAWSETYANRGLYVATGGNQGDPDDGAEGNDGWKFLLPLTLASAAILAAMSQTEQWTGTTSPEFDDYTEKEELTVTPAPEFDGYPAIEIAPVTNPNPDPGTGTNPDPGTGTNPDPGTGTNPDPGTGTNPGTGTDPESGSSSWTPPSDMGKFTLDLKQYFPFCIPFDLYAFFTCLNAEPVAPVIEWIIPLPGGKTYPFEIDLSVFDSVAQILRRMQLLLFCVGLAFKTRDLIKG